MNGQKWLLDIAIFCNVGKDKTVIYMTSILKSFKDN